MDGSSFTPIDGLGLLAGYGIKPQEQSRAPEFGPPAPTPQEHENAIAGEIARKGNETEAGRYELVSENEVGKWQEDWQKKEASSGLGGDAQRLLRIGTNSLVLGVREAVRSIPKAGPAIVYGLDAVDRWMTGKDSETILKENVKFNEARLAPEMQAARKKEFVAETKNPDGSTSYRLGPAWTDPRSYVAGAVESLPGTAVSMVPGGVLARGAYMRALATGAGEKAAAAAAARAARARRHERDLASLSCADEPRSPDHDRRGLYGRAPTGLFRGVARRQQGRCDVFVSLAPQDGQAREPDRERGSHGIRGRGYWNSRDRGEEAGLVVTKNRLPL